MIVNTSAKLFNRGGEKRETRKVRTMLLRKTATTEKKAEESKEPHLQNCCHGCGRPVGYRQKDPGYRQENAFGVYCPACLMRLYSTGYIS